MACSALLSFLKPALNKDFPFNTTDIPANLPPGYLDLAKILPANMDRLNERWKSYHDLPKLSKIDHETEAAGEPGSNLVSSPRDDPGHQQAASLADNTVLAAFKSEAAAEEKLLFDVLEARTENELLEAKVAPADKAEGDIAVATAKIDLLKDVSLARFTAAQRRAATDDIFFDSKSYEEQDQVVLQHLHQLNTELRNHHKVGMIRLAMQRELIAPVEVETLVGETLEAVYLRAWLAVNKNRRVQPRNNRAQHVVCVACGMHLVKQPQQVRGVKLPSMIHPVPHADETRCAFFEGKSGVVRISLGNGYLPVALADNVITGHIFGRFVDYVDQVAREIVTGRSPNVLILGYNQIKIQYIHFLLDSRDRGDPAAGLLVDFWQPHLADLASADAAFLARLGPSKRVNYEKMLGLNNSFRNTVDAQLKQFRPAFVQRDRVQKTAGERDTREPVKLHRFGNPTAAAWNNPVLESYDFGNYRRLFLGGKYPLTVTAKLLLPNVAPLPATKKTGTSGKIAKKTTEKQTSNKKTANKKK